MRPLSCLMMATWLLSGGSAFAEDCSSILQFGIWESRSTSKDVYEDSSFQNWSCNASAAGSNRKIDVKVDGYGSLSGSEDKAENRQSCSRTTTGNILSSRERDRSSTASGKVVDAWKGCMDSLGSHASVSYGGDPKAFSILLQRRGQSGRYPNRDIATVKTLSKGVTCTTPKKEMSAGIKFDGSMIISCRRADIKEAAEIEVNFKEGGSGQPIYVPAIIVVPPPRYTLTLNPADDAAACMLNNAEIASTNSASAPKIVDLTPRLNRGRNKLVCSGQDIHPDQNFKPCWSFSFSLTRNDAVIASADKRCCGDNSCGAPPSIPIDIDG